jgi:hypothetical protein
MTTRILWAIATAAALLSSPRVIAAEPDACIAIMLPSLRGTDGNTSDLSASIRELITNFLAGPSLKTLDLTSRLPQHAVEEAAQKDCGMVLSTTISRTRSGGSVGRVLGQAAGAAAWHVPYGSTAGSTAVRGALVAGGAAASAIASETRAKDEMRLDYRLLVSARPPDEGYDSAKAKNDGEDLVTPLIERLAARIVTAIAK